MTMRTYRYFECSNGHKGNERTSENDQPFSDSWESITLTGLEKAGLDEDGDEIYICAQCKLPMMPTPKP